MCRSSQLLIRLLGLVLVLAVSAGRADELPRYDLELSIEPAGHNLAAAVTVTLPESLAGETVDFLLTATLVMEASDPPVKKLPGFAGTGFTGINGSSVELARSDGISRYRVQLPDDSTTIRLSYEGPINFSLAEPEEDYTRGFLETPGIIDDRGIYLGGSTLWYPFFGDQLVTFKLQAGVPDGWYLISQGDGSGRTDDNVARWDSAGPVDEIYLVGGPLIRYAEPAGGVQAEVYLREADEPLAAKYLTATARYIEMYRTLIGPYPYGKFALVENFWETGYGMPSFTLLGSQIIRFPFILTSSYPHEILHNWWGNSVFVDYPTGNWAEGLTAYLADHLMKEQQGQGAEYRRDTLKKYRDFVKEDRDFPLSEFRSRHSAATEAVGYGKTMMGFHMLRLKLGDQTFNDALSRFYLNQRGKQAGFADLKSEFEKVSGQNLDGFFDQWVDRTGASDLRLKSVVVREAAGGFRVEGMLQQMQSQEPFELEVPIAITTRSGTEVKTIGIDDAETSFSIDATDRPLLIRIDPEFDLFRLLDARETAPSIGQLFGEAKIVAVLPARASAETQQAYRTLVENWAGPLQTLEIVLDSGIDALPADRGAWLLGQNNRFAEKLINGNAMADLSFDDDALTLEGDRIPFRDHSSVVIIRHPDNVEKAVGWIAIDPRSAFPGMAGKLPHYGKYSFLVFEGTEPTNTIKGEWAATDSPLRVDLRPEADGMNIPVAAISLPKRAALAELPPVFSRQRLLDHVNYLAAPELKGRGLGSPGLEKASVYIAEQFALAGLVPGGDDDSYFQTFTVDTGPDGGPHDIRNVIGYLPGTDPRFATQGALITAHYDHLGLGWPDVRAAAAGEVYAGADDNASGVAVLLELARAFAEGPAPPRTLVFVAFTGEEAGLLGSEYYVQNPRPESVTNIFGVINMDTVGRLDKQPISVLATDSASEWPHVFRGVGFTTGIKSETVGGASESSDQQSFINAGIPGVQIFTGAHLDYHRPSDTPDKVNGDGMVKVAAFVKETAVYLSEREEPLTTTITAGGAQPATNTEGNRRRVSFGTVPDFSHSGPGARVESIVPGSPAEKAGIQAGDIITRIDTKPIDNLAVFSDTLKEYSPGDTVITIGLRNGAEFQTEVELVAR